MAKPLRVDPEADEELSAAARWYEERRTGLGAELLDAVEEALRTIRRNPRSGATPPQVDPELGVRRVLAFAHASRRPGYWRDR